MGKANWTQGFRDGNVFECDKSLGRYLFRQKMSDGSLES